MRLGRGLWVVAAAALAAATAGAATAQNARDGITAWEAGRHEEAVRIWRPLAEAGDADAQCNLAQAYRLGRGVPQSAASSEQYYERAARQGHPQAAANLGLILFQNNRRREAMPWIERAAEAGDARAQYVLGTALFNGDVVARDWPRAYALMSRAAAGGLPQAQSQLAEMERHLPEADRARGRELARMMGRAERQVAAVAVPPSRGAAPSSAPQPTPQRPPVVRPAPPAATAEARRPEPASAPTPAPAVAGRWRVQLGAFSSADNARRAWEGQGRRALAGAQPFFVRAGALTRLQAGPFPNKAAADRACADARRAGLGCFTVAP